jgi:hypothetical protein
VIRSLLLVLAMAVACVPPQSARGTPSGSASATQPAASGTTNVSASGEASLPPLRVDGRVIRPGVKLRFPSRYVATTGDALTPPKTQGGIAPPALALTVAGGRAPTAETWPDTVSASSDCILVWHTNGFVAISDWQAHVQTGIGQLAIRGASDPAVEHDGAYDFTRQTIDVTTGTRATAFLKVGEGSFYFTTCGSANATDLDVVLKSFEVAQ